MVNDNHVEAEDVQRPQVNEEVVKALKAILIEAEKGGIQSFAMIRVVRPGAFNTLIVGAYSPLEVNSGADMLKAGIVQTWQLQLAQQQHALQQRGLQRATLADLSAIPSGRGRS